MSILRHAQDRFRRLQVLEEEMYGPGTSGDESPRIDKETGRKLRGGLPPDVVDRYTYVRQMSLGESPSGDDMGILDKRRIVRAGRMQNVVEVLAAQIANMEEMDEYEDEEEDEEECDCGPDEECELCAED